ncbi:hypothetical protein D3C71_1829860 [compost metagenome]
MVDVQGEWENCFLEEHLRYTNLTRITRVSVFNDRIFDVHPTGAAATIFVFSGFHRKLESIRPYLSDLHVHNATIAWVITMTVGTHDEE